jgi:site-specific recombinase XerD
MVFFMTNFEAFEKMKKIMELRGYATSTKKTYIESVEYFARYSNMSFEDMNYDHVRDFLYYCIKERGLSAQYITCMYSAIRVLYEGVLQRDWNMKHVPRMKVRNKLPQILTREEIKKLIQSLDNLKHKSYLLLSYSAGLRLSEVVNLKIKDIDSKNMLIYIRNGKGGKDRYAILSSNTLELLRDYYRQYRPKEWLFEGRDSNKPISCKSVQAIFHKAKAKAGINNSSTYHSLRHAFATHLIEDGTSLICVQNLLGHTQLNTTSKYIHLVKNGSLSTKSPADMIGGIYND